MRGNDARILIHGVDRASESEWRAFLAAHPFGQLVAGGRGREDPVVVPTRLDARRAPGDIAAREHLLRRLEQRGG